MKTKNKNQNKLMSPEILIGNDKCLKIFNTLERELEVGVGNEY